MQWYLPSKGLLYDRGEDFAVYYNPLSGDTHLISQLALSILGLVASGPLSTGHIADALLADADPGDDAEELRAALPGILRLLADLDIIRAV